MTVRIAIVEDDLKAQETLQSHLLKFGKENHIVFLIDVFSSPLPLLENYEAKYDIVFMDIQLPYINGMDAARRIRTLDAGVVLIFVTNLTQYALAGYEVEALDYIVKPVEYYHFALKMTKALRHIDDKTKDALVVPMSIGSVRISLRDIRYIEVKDHYLTYYVFDGSYSEFRTIASLEKELLGKGFARISKGCLVNLKYAASVKGYVLTLTDGTELKISQPRKRILMASLDEDRKQN